MTREESEKIEANKRHNEVIQKCRHYPICNNDGTIWCVNCECKFAALLLPVRLEPIPLPNLDDDEE